MMASLPPHRIWPRASVMSCPPSWRIAVTVKRKATSEPPKRRWKTTWKVLENPRKALEKALKSCGKPHEKRRFSTWFGGQFGATSLHTEVLPYRIISNPIIAYLIWSKPNVTKPIPSPLLPFPSLGGGKAPQKADIFTESARKIRQIYCILTETIV